jgi:O-methyltransferase involved in polyketide biosynthesis/SAM-dependent methyltransferase
MTTLAIILAVVLALSMLQLHVRLAALPVLSPSDEPVREHHRFVAAAGVHVDDATRRAASAYAARYGFDLVDLIPGDISAMSLLGLVQLFDPREYQSALLGPGISTGHALLVSDRLAGRLAAEDEVDPLAAIDGLERLDFTRRALSLRHYAPRRRALAVALGLAALPESAADRRASLNAMLTLRMDRVAVTLRGGMLFLLLALALSGVAWGWLPAALSHLEPALALAGRPFARRDRLWLTLLRLPLELLDWLQSVTTARLPPPDRSADRALYQRLVEGGTEAFFEDRREDCPLCAHGELAPLMRVGDRSQGKPGSFALERCRACGHAFQNPRLSKAGLEYYYRDFYDGIGERDMEALFAFDTSRYQARAEMLRGAAEPQQWLDVGAGHGHFCLVARRTWPDTEFWGLDMGAGVREAEERGWIDGCVSGQFPEVAGELADRFDVLSMSHYLEHTRAPDKEIRAAATALRAGGALLIELPNPECPMGRWLGSWWLPWFQPQHQRFFSGAQLDELLRSAGFEPLTWQFGAAHEPSDMVFAVSSALQALAPQPHLPWLPEQPLWRRAAGDIVWTAGMSLLPLAWLVDQLLAPWLRRGRRSNTFRVLAKKLAPGERAEPSQAPAAPDKASGDLSPTALYTAGVWSWAKLPDASLLDSPESRRVFRVVNGALGLMRLFRPGLPSLPHSLAQRHMMIEDLLERAGTEQVLELGAGLSRRGISWPELDYVELDLPAMIERKRELLRRTAAGRAALERPNLRLVEGDALEAELGALLDPERGAMIIAEGLCVYLEEGVRRALFARVAELLRGLPGGAFAFDLTPGAEEPPPGRVGRFLEGLMKRFTGGRAFRRDRHDRAMIESELRDAGFEHVEALEPGDFESLPYRGQATKVVIWRCRVSGDAAGV